MPTNYVYGNIQAHPIRVISDLTMAGLLAIPSPAQVIIIMKGDSEIGPHVPDDADITASMVSYRWDPEGEDGLRDEERNDFIRELIDEDRVMFCLWAPYPDEERNKNTLEGGEYTAAEIMDKVVYQAFADEADKVMEVGKSIMGDGFQPPSAPPADVVLAMAGLRRSITGDKVEEIIGEVIRLSRVGFQQNPF